MLTDCKTLISEGAYGKVFSVSSKYAVKVETDKGKRKRRLREEARIMKLVQGPGIPRIIHHSTIDGRDRLKMELLGPDMRKIRKSHGGGLGFRSTIMFGIQALERLEHIHSKGIIHRDIKDSNFVIGKNDPTKIYLIDFGLSVRLERYNSKNSNY